MNLFSHITMGRYLYAYFTENMNLKLDKGTFVRWNFLPDVAPSLLKLSHFKKDIYDLVMEKADYLAREGENMSTEEFSKQLGILCHFMSDFFCYAHSENFDGSKIGHLKYEIFMQFYGYRRRDMLHAVDPVSYTHLRWCCTFLTAASAFGLRIRCVCCGPAGGAGAGILRHR